MLLAALLAATSTTLSLDDGHLRLKVPASIRVQQQKVNFETVEYDLYDGGSKTPLLQIVNGGGSYDLAAFSKTCLNGRPAWLDDHGDSGIMVVGEPGSWAVAAYWQSLSGDQLVVAKKIIASLEIDFGPKC
jgi:hypothetical protein